MKPHRSIFRRYLLYFSIVISIAIIATGSLQTLSLYHHQQQQIAASLELETNRVQDGIRDYLQRLTGQIKHLDRWTRWPYFPGGLKVTRLEYMLLLRQQPAITALRLLDASGRERLLVSRTAMDRVDSGIDLTAWPAFSGATTHPVWFGKAGFRHHDPYFRIAVGSGSGSDTMVTVADIDLSHLSDLLADLAGNDGSYAYLIDSEGKLLAHPDRYRVRRNIFLSSQPQVAAALTSSAKAIPPVDYFPVSNDHPVAVFASYARIAETGWQVIVERPAALAFAPLYSGLWRIATLLVLGLLMALIAGALLARHMSLPIRTLRSGVEAFANGDLSHRIQLDRDDELAALADAFNRMAAQIQTSHHGLEQKVLERTQAVTDANRHKSEFLATMSHEIRSPLNAILGFSEALSLRLFGELNHKQTEYIDNIQQAGQHLLQLLNDILDLSKVEAGHMELELSGIDVDKFLSAALTMVKANAVQRGIDLRLEVATDIPEIDADQRKLTQVVVNLLSNALKFTDRGGRITLSADLCVWPASGDGATRGIAVSCADTGIGIPASELKTVFDEFRQLEHDGPGNNTKGTGLGLSLSRRLVELHGGKLSVTSIHGQGSTFTFTVPEKQ